MATFYVQKSGDVIALPMATSNDVGNELFIKNYISAQQRSAEK